jgi:5-methylcytosine-specific restriction protein A
LLDDARNRGGKPGKSHVSTTVYHRDPVIAATVKKRANGLCDLCGRPAPFNRANGLPYLEEHHLVRLADGGDDSIGNAVALCPNCHRKMHVVNDENDTETLYKKDFGLRKSNE